MIAETRYAVYFVPRADTALYRFGASVLGYDGYTGNDMPFAEGAAPSWGEVVREPRRYGFHATLKAPFRLKEGCREQDLLDALDIFARTHSPSPEFALDIRQLENFIALTPIAQATGLDVLAAACVRDFDHFRAPTNEKERARRLASKLNDRQLTYLDRWGYPYVFEEFRFHLTLTGPLDARDREKTLRFLRGKMEQEVKVGSLVIDQIVISRQINALAPFSVLRAASLGTA